MLIALMIKIIEIVNITVMDRRERNKHKRNKLGKIQLFTTVMARKTWTTRTTTSWPIAHLSPSRNQPLPDSFPQFM